MKQNIILEAPAFCLGEDVEILGYSNNCPVLHLSLSLSLPNSDSGSVFRDCVSYYCAQYIHQATQGESKRVTDKYITVS